MQWWLSQVFTAHLEGTRIMSEMPSRSTNARPPTRADVARYAGVSTAVVSYVVNDGPRRSCTGDGCAGTRGDRHS